MGKLTKFEVEFDHPRSMYFAGQDVGGNVVIELTESIKVKRIYMKLMGKTMVEWGEGSSRNRRLYRGEEVYFNYRLVFLSPADENDVITLEAGSHSYPFRITLPENIPSSFEGVHGSVRYSAKATIEKPWKFNDETRNHFVVKCFLDINLESPSMKVAVALTAVSFLMIGRPVSVTNRLLVLRQRKCFVPNEMAYVNAIVENRSNWNVTNMWITLKERTEYRGHRVTFIERNIRTCVVEHVLATLENNTKIPPGEKHSWNNVAIRIPHVAASKLPGCSYIDISYEIKFHTSFGLKLPIEIVIGTVPLRNPVPYTPVVTIQPHSRPVSASFLSENDQSQRQLESAPPLPEDKTAAAASD